MLERTIKYHVGCIVEEIQYGYEGWCLQTHTGSLASDHVRFHSHLSIVVQLELFQAQMLQRSIRWHNTVHVIFS